MSDNPVALGDVEEMLGRIVRVLADINRNLIAIEAAILGVDEPSGPES